MIPRIIHTIHFQWDEHEWIDPKGADFDQKPYLALCRYAPDFDTRLWTYPKTRQFCLEYYPAVWSALEKCSHPVMLIDVLRWLVVFHYGGIYWQMRTTPLVGMEAFLPAPGKNVRLFTENEQTEAQCQAMAAEPIREGRPEERIRISNQVFSAAAQSQFVEKTIDFLLGRVQRLHPQKDYDILYITANAAVSAAYDQFGKDDLSVERVDLVSTRRMLKWRYGGAWRRDTRLVHRVPATDSPAKAKPRLERFLGLARLRHLMMGCHPHNQMLDRIDATSPRHSLVPRIIPWAQENGIRSIVEAPSGTFTPLIDKVAYTGCDPRWSVVRANRHLGRNSRSRFKCINMVYGNFPTADMIICADYLEWLSYTEAQRVLKRIAAARPRFIALTGYPLLTERWDTATGDFRPICFQEQPFQFPSPVAVIELGTRANGGRPDRSLMIWELRDIQKAGLPPVTENANNSLCSSGGLSMCATELEGGH